VSHRAGPRGAMSGRESYTRLSMRSGELANPRFWVRSREGSYYWRNPFVWKRLQKYYKQEYGLLILSYSGLSPS
jgi:hypothetical protein